MSNSTVFLPPEITLVATLSDTHTSTSRKHKAEQSIIIPNLLQILQSFLVVLLTFASEK